MQHNDVKNDTTDQKRDIILKDILPKCSSGQVQQFHVSKGWNQTNI